MATKKQAEKQPFVWSDYPANDRKKFWFRISDNWSMIRRYSFRSSHFTCSNSDDIRLVRQRLWEGLRHVNQTLHVADTYGLNDEVVDTAAVNELSETRFNVDKAVEAYQGYLIVQRIKKYVEEYVQEEEFRFDMLELEVSEYLIEQVMEREKKWFKHIDFNYKKNGAPITKKFLDGISDETLDHLLRSGKCE